MRSSLLRAPRRGDSGAVAILVVIFLVVFMVLLAFVVDLGRVYLTRAQLQNAVDAGALAGAQELPDSPSQAMSVARSYAESNGVPVGMAGSLAPYQGDPCAVLATGSTQVNYIFGGFVGLSGGTVSARAVGARNCDFGYNVYGQESVTYNGNGSAGGFIYAGASFTYNGNGTPTDLDGDGCVDSLFDGVWVTGARTDNQFDPMDKNKELELSRWNCNGQQNNSSGTVTSLPAANKHYSHSPSTEELSAEAYGEYRIGVNASDYVSLVTQVPAKPANLVASGTTGNCNPPATTSTNTYCNGSVPANDLTVGNGFNGQFGASSGIGTKSGSKSFNFTSTSNFSSQIYSGGAVSGTSSAVLDVPTNTTNVVATGAVSYVSLPAGFSGKVYGSDLQNIAFEGGFSGTLVAYAPAAGTYGQIANTTIPANSSGTIIVEDIGNGFTIGSGFSGTLIINSTKTVTLTLPANFTGRILSGGLINISGTGALPTTCTPGDGESCGVIFSSGTGTAIDTSGALVTDATIWTPYGNVVVDNSSTKTYGPVIAKQVTYNGSGLVPTDGNDLIAATGDVFLAE